MSMANDMNPTDCGWKEESRQLIPVMTEKNAAPDELLKVIPVSYTHLTLPTKRIV